MMARSTWAVIALLGVLIASCQASSPPPASPAPAAPSKGGLFWGKDRKGNPTLISEGTDEERQGKTQLELRNEEVSQDLAATLKTHTMGGLFSKVALSRGNRAGNRMHDNEYKASAASKLDLSSLRHVLAVDKEKMVAVVEPLVSMRRLVDATLPLGLLPKVLPEFKQITVGGAVMGAALESSSHKHGQFLDCCKSVTVLLPDGTIETCSRETNKELFNSLSGSYGTLAILLKAEVSLQPVKPFVKVSYTSHPTPDEAIERMTTMSSGPSAPEFIEGLHFPPASPGKKKGWGSGTGNRTVVMTADFADPPGGFLGACRAGCCPVGVCTCVGGAATGGFGPVGGGDGGSKVVRTDRVRGAWFSEHVAKVGDAGSGPDKGSSYSELIPTREYLFRYDNGAFWMARPMDFGSHHTRLTPASILLFLLSSPPLRFLFGPMFTTKTLFSALRSAPRQVVAEKMVVMDLYMPAEGAASLIRRVGNTVPISTPLWLCPIKGSTDPQPLSPHGHSPDMFVNVGIYGRVCDGKGVEYSKALEEYCAANMGRKMLYSQNFYTAEQFWGREGGSWSKGAMYDQEGYDQMRKKYNADKVLPDLYSKVCEGSRAAPSDTFWSACKRALFRAIL